MFSKGRNILDTVLSEYSKLETHFQRGKKWNEMSEDELWQELCLCILSSNVPYELAQSAFYHLLDIGYLSLDWFRTTKSAKELVAHELKKPIYLPRKLNGSYRKYRFPNARAKNICQAAIRISSEKGWLSRLLQQTTSETEAREILVANIPGIGLKEASHFLRNIRYSTQLAIIDSHVVSFLTEIGAGQKRKLKTITPNTYLKLERVLQEMCNEHRLNLSVFDMAIWNYMRRRA